MSLEPLYVLLEKCLFKTCAPILIGLLVFLEWSHVSSLYILEIKPLSEVSLANMFSHMVGSLFILLMFSLVMQKLFISFYRVIPVAKTTSTVLNRSGESGQPCLVPDLSGKYFSFSH